MSFPWQIATSSAAGALITLVGVFAGAVLTGRAQMRHWSRDKQVAVCAEVVAESIRIQRSLDHRWKEGAQTDWVPWNQALAAVWLLSDSKLVDAAAQIDLALFRVKEDIKAGKIVDNEAWEGTRDQVESARLDFINVARQRVLRNGAPMTRPLAEWRYIP